MVHTKYIGEESWSLSLTEKSSFMIELDVCLRSGDDDNNLHDMVHGSSFPQQISRS